MNSQKRHSLVESVAASGMPGYEVFAARLVVIAATALNQLIRFRDTVDSCANVPTVP